MLANRCKFRYLWIVLLMAAFLPADKAPAAGVVDAQWIDVEGTRIPVPPAEHPRLNLRARDLPDLERRMAHPALAAVRRELEERAERDLQTRVEWQALQYLLNRDRTMGREAVVAALDTMRRVVWPDRQDISRAIGRMMVTGAMVYDWCYDLLTPDEQQLFITEFVRMAKMLESGYPPVRQGSVTGHSSERMIMRDMISAGIAIYDEFPEMYRLAAGRFYRDHVPVRNWFYPGHAYHQGDSYGIGRFWSDIFPTWIFDRLGAGNPFHPAQQFVPYQWIYMRRPDGQLIRNGDTFLHSTSRGKAWPLRGAGLYTASYYGDGYILEDYLRAPGIRSEDKIYEFLWRDPDLQPRPNTDLPLSRYMGFPFGWMIARTGWGPDCVIAEFKINVYNFLNHQHLDAGSFQIYHKGALAIDSGLYNGSSGGYGSIHNQNYYKRTIAHNALLVYDPEESFPRWRNGPTANDGGQRMPNNWREPRVLEDLLSQGYQTGAVLGHAMGPDPSQPEYTYLKGDITAAYGDKVRQVQRSFVFLNRGGSAVPAVLVVFDRVVSSNPAFRKTWLLHSMEEPVIENGQIRILKTTNGDHGKLINTTLLPALRNAEIRKIGGADREFLVHNINYPNERRPGRDAAAERGAWRVEISPREPAETDHFLNVLQVMDRDHQEYLDIDHHVENDVVVLRITERVIVFHQSGERRDRELSFTVTAPGVLKILITDLAPGTWQIRKDGDILIPGLPVASESGILYFEGPPGAYTLRR